MKPGDARYHEVSWSPESVRRFWDWVAASPSRDSTWFSRRFARRIVGLAARQTPLADPVVDLGAGPGFLCEELLRRGHTVRALDGSEATVARARARLEGRSGFLGADVAPLDALPLADASTGTLFLVEVLEHLVPDERERVLAEVGRVLRPGGSFVVTTPNAEDLDEQKIACPECGCVFHRVQHVASFDAEGIRDVLVAAGFEVAFARPVNLRHFPDRALGALVSRVVRCFADAAASGPLPHLVAVARRPPVEPAA